MCWLTHYCLREGGLLVKMVVCSFLRSFQEWSRNHRKCSYLACIPLFRNGNHSIFGGVCILVISQSRRSKMPSLLLKTRLEAVFSCGRSTGAIIPSVYKIGHSHCFRHPLRPIWIQAKSAARGGWRWRVGPSEVAVGGCISPTYQTGPLDSWDLWLCMW